MQWHRPGGGGGGAGGWHTYPLAMRVCVCGVCVMCVCVWCVWCVWCVCVFVCVCVWCVCGVCVYECVVCMGKNSRGRSGLQCRLYTGHFFLSLIPGKTYKLGTSETCDVTGHDLFVYEIYLNYLDDINISHMFFKIKEIMMKVVYFCAAYNPHKLTMCMQLPNSVPTSGRECTSLTNLVVINRPGGVSQ